MKVCCNGTTIQFISHSPESPDILWKVCIERTIAKWKELAPNGNFLSSYMKSSLVFFLINSDNDIQIHHWINTDEHLVPKHIMQEANKLRILPELNKGTFAAEIQPWGKAI
jgi:hypothetical protein